jgi:hypothetical protein
LGGTPPLFDPDQGILVQPVQIAKLAAILKFGKLKGQVTGLFVDERVGVVDVHVCSVISYQLAVISWQLSVGSCQKSDV